jgi:hypothetical protein
MFPCGCKMVGREGVRQSRGGITPGEEGLRHLRAVMSHSCSWSKMRICHRNPCVSAIGFWAGATICPAGRLSPLVQPQELTAVVTLILPDLLLGHCVSLGDSICSQLIKLCSCRECSGVDLPPIDPDRVGSLRENRDTSSCFELLVVGKAISADSMSSRSGRARTWDTGRPSSREASPCLF